MTAVSSVYFRHKSPQVRCVSVRLHLLDQSMDPARGETATPAFAEPDFQYGERPEEG